MSCFCLKRNLNNNRYVYEKFINFFFLKSNSFHNGGLLFSTTVLSSIALVSLYTFLLLVETRNKIPVSFGDIGGILFGKKMRYAVLLAITFSQVNWELIMISQCKKKKNQKSKHVYTDGICMCIYGICRSKCAGFD